MTYLINGVFGFGIWTIVAADVYYLFSTNNAFLKEYLLHANYALIALESLEELIGFIDLIYLARNLEFKELFIALFVGGSVILTYLFLEVGFSLLFLYWFQNSP